MKSQQHEDDHQGIEEFLANNHNNESQSVDFGRSTNSLSLAGGGGSSRSVISGITLDSGLEESLSLSFQTSSTISSAFLEYEHQPEDSSFRDQHLSSSSRFKATCHGMTSSALPLRKPLSPTIEAELNSSVKFRPVDASAAPMKKPVRQLSGGGGRRPMRRRHSPNTAPTFCPPAKPLRRTRKPTTEKVEPTLSPTLEKQSISAR